MSWCHHGLYAGSLSHTHTHTDQMSTQWSSHSQKLKLDNQCDAHKCTDLHTSYHFSVGSFPPGIVLLTQQPSQPHMASPLSYCTETHSSPNKSRTSTSIFVSGSRGLCRRMGNPSVSLTQPIHNSHSPTGN